MVDFLKANPYVTMEDYMWKMNPCLIRLMSVDNTRVHYLSEKEAKKKKAVVIDDASALFNDLGIPVLSKEDYDKGALSLGGNNK